MREITEDERQALLEGQDLEAFRASPGVDAMRKVLDDEAKRAVIALLSCDKEEILEWRGRLQALFGVMDGLSGRIAASRELASRIRAEVEADRERDRASLEAAIERRERPTNERPFAREGAY